MFATLADSLVKDSLKTLNAEALQRREAACRTFCDFYEGGDKVKPYLIKHAGEEPEEFTERQQRFASLNYVKRYADEIIDGIYGDPVRRTLEGIAEDSATAKVYAGVYRDAQIDRTQREFAWGMVVVGDGWFNVAWKDRLEAMTILPVYAGNVWWETDPDDPTRIVELVERRILRRTDQGPVYGYWIWTLDWKWFVDEDGKTLQAKSPNPYGRIPYVRAKGQSIPGYDEGRSYIADAVTIQALINNRLSDQDVQIVNQTFSDLILENVNVDTIGRGPRRAIMLQGTNAEAYYISPTPMVAETEDTIEKLIVRMGEVLNVSISLIRGDIEASGVALAMRLRPFVRVIQSGRTSAGTAEIELGRTVCAVGSYHGLALPADGKPEFTWSENTLPTDKAAEFDRDYMQVTASPALMTAREFFEKWHPGLKGKALDEAFAELEAEREKARAQTPKIDVGGFDERDPL